jgi:hypothetical protein
LQMRVDALKRLLGRWDGCAGLGAKTEEHRTISLILLPHLSLYVRGSSAALLGEAPV